MRIRCLMVFIALGIMISLLLTGVAYADKSINMGGNAFITVPSSFVRYDEKTYIDTESTVCVMYSWNQGKSYDKILEQLARERYVDYTHRSINNVKKVHIGGEGYNSKLDTVDTLVLFNTPNGYIVLMIWRDYGYPAEKSIITRIINSIRINSGSSSKKIEKISLSRTKATLYKGETLSLKVKKISPSGVDKNNITWKSSNTKVATVNQNGVVTAKGKGSCKIYCKATDGSDVKATCKIVVN